MLRREVMRLGGLFGLGAGTPSRFPYTDRPQPSPGIGPSQGQVVRARTVIVSGRGAGVFVYFGTPGPGTLIASQTSATSDPFGNPTIQGTASYNDSLSAIAMVNGSVFFYNRSGPNWVSFASITPFRSGIQAANGAPLYDQNGNQLAAPRSDITITTLTNPTVAANFTIAWPIPANDASAGTVYRIEVPFFGVWEASGNLNLQFDLNGASTNLVPVAAGLAVAGHNYGGVARLYLQILTTGAAGTCAVWMDGAISDTSINRTPATSCDLFGIRNSPAVAIDTTVANTLAVSASFSVSNASQTIVGQGSVFTRSGP